MITLKIAVLKIGKAIGNTKWGRNLTHSAYKQTSNSFEESFAVMDMFLLWLSVCQIVSLAGAGHYSFEIKI